MTITVHHPRHRQLDHASTVAALAYHLPAGTRTAQAPDWGPTEVAGFLAARLAAAGYAIVAVRPPAELPELPERCPHGYHVTEGNCPTCDLDRDGRCGPYCQHDHTPARRPDPARLEPRHLAALDTVARGHAGTVEPIMLASLRGEGWVQAPGGATTGPDVGVWTHYELTDAGRAALLAVASDDDEGCPGHESLSGAYMGESVYCDGSCVDRPPDAWPTVDGDQAWTDLAGGGQR